MKRFFLFLAVVISLVLTFASTALATAADDLLSVPCDLCHFCNAPYGVCIFIWIMGGLVLLILLVALIKTKKRCPVCREKCKKKAKICPYCKYNFVTGELPPIARHMAQQTSVAQLQKMPASQTAPQQPTTQDKALQPEEAIEETCTICPTCGKKLPVNAVFCGGCGHKL